MRKSLVLAEKPSVAVNIARVLGANNRHDGYFEGNGYIVTFAVGHLLTLYDCKDYDTQMEKWDLANFPFIPNKFKYKLIDDNGLKKQFGIIKKLVNECDLIINAADADREAEVLTKMILNATGTKKPIKRLWITSHTPKDIKRGMANLKDEKEMVGLQDAGFSRQLADWIIGINFTSVATLKYGSNGSVLNIGRVLLPTTKLIYDREMEIKNFTPKDYFELKAIFLAKNGEYSSLYIDLNKETKFDNKEKLIEIKEEIEKAQRGSIIRVNREKGKEYAPRLFNLTDLQGHITSKFQGFSADKVLKISQKLYESRFITYPRTSSKYLDDTQVDDAREALEAVIKNLPYKDKVSFSKTKKVFDSTKVDSHPAIIPTYIVPEDNKLTKDEKIVYQEVVKRFVANFMPPVEFEKIVAYTKVGEHFFISKGKVVLKDGWLEVYGKKTDKDVLPELNEGEIVKLTRAEVDAKQTIPPKRYTEKSLLSAMENCGNNVEDVKSVMEGYMLGTPATRAEILKKIQNAGYVVKKGKSFFIADMGIRLIETFPVKELMNVDYTGRIEKKLKEIEKGKFKKEDFLLAIIEFVQKGVETIKNSNGSVGSNGSKSGKLNVIGKCPDCGSDVVEGKKGYGCSGYKNGCKFVIWKDCAFFKKMKKKMTLSIAKSLIKDGRVFVKGFTSPRSGKKFDCELEYVKQENGNWGYNLIFNNRRENNELSNNGAVVGKCLACGGDVKENSNAYRCSSEGCNFVLWKDDMYLKRFRKKMTKELAKKFLADGRVYMKGLYSEKKKKKFDACLVLTNQGEYWGYRMEFQ